MLLSLCRLAWGGDSSFLFYDISVLIKLYRGKNIVGTGKYALKGKWKWILRIYFVDYNDLLLFSFI